jgi:hypothetical protein
MENSSKLIPLIRQQAFCKFATELNILRDTLLDHYGDAIQAILFYGSCFRNGNIDDGIVDLYMIVDHYNVTYVNRFHALLNKLLPPNVFYLEADSKNIKVRAKYAVISMSDFQRGVSMSWFHSYLWGRFAQPAGLLYFRDDSAADSVCKAFCQAVITFMKRTLPSIPEKFDTLKLWHQGLLLSYRAELRAERHAKLIRLVEASSEYYDQLTQEAMSMMPYAVDGIPGEDFTNFHSRISRRKRLANQLAWRARFILGKLLSLLRLSKALFTFKGGIDYVLWKIERHSGIRIEVEPRLRRIPIAGILSIFWRLYRRGAFR